MEPQYAVLAIILAIFLYWKFGKGISLPGVGGVSGGMSRFFGSFSLRPVLWVTIPILLLIGVYYGLNEKWFPTTVFPADVINWFWKQDLQIITVAIVVVAAIILIWLLNTSKNTWIMKSVKTVILVLASLWVLNGPLGDAVRKQINTERTIAPPPAPREASKPASRGNEEITTVTATNKKYEEVIIPKNSLFKWSCPPGTLVWISHDLNPRGTVYDCEDFVELGNYLKIPALRSCQKQINPWRG